MHQLYNSTMCQSMFSNLPKCLEAIQLTYHFSNSHYRARAEEICSKYLGPVTTDIVFEDIRRKVCRRSFGNSKYIDKFKPWI